MVGGRWVEEDFCGYRRDPAGLYGDDGADVYLWQEGADVDGQEESDGEVLAVVDYGRRTMLDSCRYVS